MLTRIRVKNFKKLNDADFELGKSVVLVGPNNSGKTTALQALALWSIGVRQWNAKRQGKASPEKRPGVTINRNDLISIPIPDVNLLWRDLHVRSISNRGKEQRTQNIRIDIVVDGVTAGREWSCGLEFDYANEESFYCRPLRLSEDKQPQRMPVCKEADGVKVAFLPPMSGLADREFIKQPGEIGLLIGQGQTAQVLRNLCLQIYAKSEDHAIWNEMAGHIQRLFGVDLLPPSFIAERSEILMAYRDENRNTLDLSASGRGLQQTLLLLAHLYGNPRTVLLLDEPDAHLEIIRQFQTYHLLTEIADRQQSQIIAASHSEVVLNEAAGRGKVIAFVGRPHTLNNRPSQLAKSLTDIGWDLYFQAEQKGWVLCLEGPSDLAILQTFARTLGHRAAAVLADPFVHYVASNLPQKARDLFHGLREAKPDLVGIAIFDRIPSQLQADQPLRELMWSRRELENYFCGEATLLAYASEGCGDDLFSLAGADRRLRAMRKAIDEVSRLLAIDELTPWSADVKATDQVLDRVFRLFFRELQLPVQFRKSDYHVLAGLLPKAQIDPEIERALDAIVEVAAKATPRT
jgi:ABC-type transport system involved in cytochrome c biogenesis ATPase subunit